MTWLVVDSERFRYTASEPAELASSAHGRRYFCPECGTPVACLIDTRPEHVDVTVGSLDHPERHPPTLAVHGDTRLGWVPREPFAKSDGPA